MRGRENRCYISLRWMQLEYNRQQSLISLIMNYIIRTHRGMSYPVSARKEEGDRTRISAAEKRNENHSRSWPARCRSSKEYSKSFYAGPIIKSSIIHKPFRLDCSTEGRRLITKAPEMVPRKISWCKLFTGMMNNGWFLTVTMG